jgi:hypothetical protein
MDVAYFLEKIPETSDHRNTVAMAAEEVSRFNRAVATIKSDRKLSSEGHNDRIKIEAESARNYLKSLRVTQNQDVANLARRKAHFQLRPVDKADLWGEHRARELRDHMQKIPLADRIRLALQDRACLRAILDSQEFLTGITDDVRERLIQVELEHEHGAEPLQALHAEQAILDIVDKALETVEGQLERDAEQSTASATIKWVSPAAA